jgi:hypothetical protein
MRSPTPARLHVPLAAALALAPTVAAAQNSAPSAAPSRETTPTSQPGTSPRASGPQQANLLRIAVPGEWQVRGVALSEIPLATTPGTTAPASLGQRSYFEQWFRFRPEMSVGGRFRVIAQFDVARGILFGESTRMVELSRDPRGTLLTPFPYGAFDLRWLYVDWALPFGVLRAGQQGSYWGLGIVANDGNHPQVFGDYRMGDIVERLAFATRPLGANSDFVLAVAGDLVYRDRLARLFEYEVPIDHGEGVTMFPSRVLGADRALQGVLSVFYQDHACTSECERKRVGVYAVYRDQVNRVGLDFGRAGDYLRVLVGDIFARWELPTPDGRARVFAALEMAGIYGGTTLARNVVNQRQDVIQFGCAFQLGLERPDRYIVTLEGGYASGDSNPVDGAQRRFTFNPDHRVGLILFPELIAWQTARSASIAVDERIVGRPTPGAELLPSSGGVTNAAYLYPTAVVNLTRSLDVRAGMVLGVASTDFVDPTQFQLYGRARNFRGGDARARDLGVEFDLGLMGRAPLGGGITLTGGAQGGVLFPGHAFDDENGRSLPTLWLAQARGGLLF